MKTDLLEKGYQHIRRTLEVPNADAAVILGSGWSDAIDFVRPDRSMPYSRIKIVAGCGVDGHAGRLDSCRLHGKRFLIFRGRRHFYEGNGWAPVAFPVYAAVRAGCRHILLTNAAGSLRSRIPPGSFMIIRDHLNLMGSNPLIGPHQHFWGPRFPDLSGTYDEAVARRVLRAMRGSSLPAHFGIYVAVSGPCYETPAEASALRRLGADAVGMSTVPEAILAHAAGLQVTAVSFISNAAGASGITTHEDVLRAASSVRRTMTAALRLILREIVHAM